VNLSTNLEESDTVESLILSLELVISIDMPLNEKKVKKIWTCVKKSNVLCWWIPPQSVEPSIEENKAGPYCCMLIIMVFLCVPNRDGQGLW